MHLSLFNPDAPGNRLRDLWDSLSKLPGGVRLFSHAIGRVAPYSGSIHARVLSLERGRCQVSMRDRRALRNPFKSIHAVALVNLAELAGNLCLAYSLPDDARFIVAGLSIDYKKKARGTITARCRVAVESSERREHVVVVQLFDTVGDVVAAAQLRTLVGPKPAGRGA